MGTRSRIKKLEAKINPKEDLIYLIDPFANKGEEVVVSGDGVHKRISIEEYNKIDTSNYTTIGCFAG